MKNFTWTIIANLLSAVVKWSYIIFIARILAKEDVGLYSLALALSAPIALFFNFRLRTLFVTKYNYNFYNYQFIRNILDLLSILVIFIVSFIAYSDYLIIILLVGLIKIMDLRSELYYAIPNFFGNLKTPSILLIVKYIINFIIFSTSLFLWNDLALTLTYIVLFQLIYLIFIERVLCKKYLLEEDATKNYIGALLKIGLSLGFIQLVVSLNANIPKYIIENLLSLKELADFSILVYIFTIGNIFVSALIQNLLPHLRNLYNKKDITQIKKIVFNRIVISVIPLSIITIIIVYFYGIEFIGFIYGDSYINDTNEIVLIVLVIALFVNAYSAVIDNTLILFNLIKKQIYISLFMVVFTIVLGYIFIINYGLIGAALSILFANFIQLVMRIIYLIFNMDKEVNNN